MPEPGSTPAPRPTLAKRVATRYFWRMSAACCPVCRIELVLVNVESASIPVCGRCGGSWLDNASSQRVVAGTLSRHEKQIAGHPAGANGSQGAYRTSESASGPRPCAVCGAPMAATEVPGTGITIDVCAAHGTWFDALELAAVAQFFELKNAADDAEAAVFGAEIGADRQATALADLRLTKGLLGRILF
jgi:Zn-finger nucleic acid-binding protein